MRNALAYFASLCDEGKMVFQRCHQVGQKVTIAARSIIRTNGADLKPSILELQV
jgi:hypothetical protein